MIKIEVKPFYEIKEIIGKSCLQMEVEEGITVKGLLLQLVQTYGPELRKALMDSETGEIKSHYLILINGRVIAEFPAGIDTLLKDGHVISIMLFLVGG